MNLTITKQSIRKKFLEKRDKLHKSFSKELEKNLINNFIQKLLKLKTRFPYSLKKILKIIF